MCKGPSKLSQDFLSAIRNYFIPGLVLINVDPNETTTVTTKSALHYKMLDDKPTVYLCHNETCELPITGLQQLNERLSEKYLFKNSN